jgi:outer membrane lipoprotein-sorting protein
MKRAILSIAVAGAICTGASAGVSVAASDANRGYAVYAERERRDQGYGDQRVKLRMTLKSPGGRTATRELTLVEAEGRGGKGDQTLIAFDAPADIAGTELLTHEHPGARDDDQWLYMPARKRTKRIASSDRSGRFVGTEYSYEDLAGDQLEDFTYRYIRLDAVEGRPAHLIERIPLNPSSEYSRQETWVDTRTDQVVKARLYDRKGRHIKTLVADDWRKYQGRYWRAHRMRMTHVASGRSTEMVASDYELGTGVPARTFHQGALGR